MGKSYGYYGVIQYVEGRVVDGDYMVNIMCENGSTSRICAPVDKFKLEELKRGTVVIYSKSYYWNLCYLNTDIGEFKHGDISILKKIFIDNIKPSKEEIRKIEENTFLLNLFYNLYDLEYEDRLLWFHKFIDRSVTNPAIRTVGEDGEMLWDFYTLNVRKNMR